MSASRPRILVIDDEPQIHRFLQPALEAAGYEPVRADTAAETRELRGRLRRALGRIAARPAEVFVLRALEGLQNREVARLLGSSPATVAVQYFRARTQLRKELLAEGGDPS